MRFLHLTDSHLGIDRHYRGADPRWRRAHDHQDALSTALAPALRGEVDAVIHTGDLFDRSQPPPEAVAAARALFAEVGREVPVVITHGNHDWRGLTPLLGGLLGVTVVDEPTAVDVKGVRVGVVPWKKPAAAWAEAARTVGEADLWATHQAFSGSRVPGFTFRPGRPDETIGAEHLPRGARWILSGHVHPRQWVEVGGATVVHAGSTERTAFSEHAEAKGYVIWELGDRFRFRLVDLPTRRMVVVRGEVDVDRVADGDLVRLEGPARTPEVEAAVHARGGWVAPWSPDRQAGLFARRGRSALPLEPREDRHPHQHRRHEDRRPGGEPGEGDDPRSRAYAAETPAHPEERRPAEEPGVQVAARGQEEPLPQ